ncbi:hypothetical protein [Halalkalibacter flavus]
MQEIWSIIKTDPYTGLILVGGVLCAVILVVVFLYQTATLLLKR